MSERPAPVKRIVRPRSTSASHMPIIALSRDAMLLERTGEVYPIDQLPAAVISEPPSILVGQTFGYYLEKLEEHFTFDENFQYRLHPVKREALNLNEEPQSRVTTMQTICAFVGFKGGYHYPLDPVSFVRLSIAEIDGDSDDTPFLESLMRWGGQVREFCAVNDLTVKPTAGGLAGQLLRDKRFYPEARRKVPKYVNVRARENLPGNYYRLYAEEGRFYEATYLDLASAHHNCASEIAFPDANTLRGYGYDATLKDKPWTYPKSPRFGEILAKPGLFLVKLYTPHLPPNSFPPPYMESQGGRLAWVYSNELTMIRELGGRIAYIVAAFVSDEPEEGLTKYAQWAIRELENNADKKEWLKPTLLSAYGMLAAKPRQFEVGYRRAKSGEKKRYPVGRTALEVFAHSTSKEIETSIANVIHRGMIEAEVRKRCLSLARDLTRQGAEVLCIYADSIFVRDAQLPLLPRPWTVKARVTGLRFLSPTHFVSREITRLPGISKTRPDRAAVVRSASVRAPE